MAKTRQEKEKLLNFYQEILKQRNSFIVAEFSRLKTLPLFQFKSRLAEKEIYCQVIKNNLFRIALNENKIQLPPEILDKPLVIVYTHKDEIDLAKECVNFNRENENFKILGGILEKSFVELSKIKELATLPDKQTLLARTVMAINAPYARFIYALRYNQSKLIYILQNKVNSN